MAQQPADRSRSEKTSAPQWQSLHDFARKKQADSGLKAWLSVVEGCIGAIERTAWQGRELADQAYHTLRAMGRGANAVSQEMQHLRDEARRWPARLKRLTLTGWMLTKVLGSYRLWSTKSAFLPRSMQATALEKLHQRNARRFRNTSLEQGGAFLKIGQLLSSRPDLLPQAWIDELTVLQDRATPFPFQDLKTVLENQFNQPLTELFAQIDEQPLAAASIGQVHRAQLHDGRQVAVKVLRPGLEDVVEQDMALLTVFMDAVKSALPPMDTRTIVKEIKRTVREELDFQREAHALVSIGEQLAEVDGVHVPTLVPALSNRQVLTTEFVQGRKLTSVLDALQHHDRPAVDGIFRRLLDAWFSQVLHGGLFHADPHPGNILVTNDNQLVLLDFGCCQALSTAARHGYFRIVQAGVVNDRQVIADTLTQLGFATRSGNPDTLLAFVSAMVDQLHEAVINAHDNASWPTPEALMEQVAGLLVQMEEDPVDTLPGDFIMLARVFGTLGGLFMHYRPNVDIATLIMRYLTQPLDAVPAVKRAA